MEYPNQDAGPALDADGNWMMPERRYAIIPTNGRDCLWDCLERVMPQVDRTILVVTKVGALSNIPSYLLAQDNWSTIVDTNGPPNISRWWNRGLFFISRNNFLRPEWTYDVAVLNDDALVPDGWFDAVSAGMRAEGAAAGCSGGSGVVVHRQPGPVGLETRMQGFAFMLAGEKGIVANESLHWYFSDDHIDWSARMAGGMVMIPGFPVEHLHPNAQMTAELHAQTAIDAQRFVDIWGMRPW